MYKEMLNLAWEVDDSKNELLAYNRIGMQYYHLNDFEKASYYFERLQTGTY
jgi:hypothetical protein